MAANNETMFYHGFITGVVAFASEMKRIAPLQTRLDITDILNQTKINCRRILADIRSSSDAITDLRTYHSSVLALEEVMFASLTQKADSEIWNHLGQCKKSLQALFQSLTNYTPPDSDSNGPRLFIVYLLAVDLRLIESVVTLADYYRANPLAPLRAEIEEMNSEHITSEMELAIVQRQSKLTSGNCSLHVDISKPDSDTLLLIHSEQFITLSKGLKASTRDQLARIIATNELVCFNLKNLRAQLDAVRQGLAVHQPFQISRLALLMHCLDREVSSFTDENLTEPIEEFLNPMFDPGMADQSPKTAASIFSEDSGERSPNRDLGGNGNLRYATCSNFNALDLFQTAKEAIPHNEPPTELLDTIQRLCHQFGVTDASWSLSTKSAQHIIVSAKGVTKDVKGRLEGAMAKAYPDFKTDFVDTPLVSNNLSAMVVQRTCNKDHPSVQWGEDDSATCELLLVGRQPHKDDREMFYAVTSAHLLLHDHEMKALEDKKCIDRRLELNDKRYEVNKRIGEHVYLVRDKNDPQCTSSQHVHLCNPPLVSFRSYQHEADDKCHRFMTDIALIPFEVHSNQSVRDVIQRFKIEPISSILELTPEEVLEINTSSQRINANKGRVGTTVRMKQPLTPTPGHKLEVGIHIPFVLDEGCPPFQAGDSGSLIYIVPEGTDNKIAIGILKGNRPEPEEHVYQAIVLHAAIDDIEGDYKHLVNSLQLYHENSSSGCNVPRSGPVPARANSAR